jgi:hypothetical protein
MISVTEKEKFMTTANRPVLFTPDKKARFQLVETFQLKARLNGSIKCQRVALTLPTQVSAPSQLRLDKFKNKLAGHELLNLSRIETGRVCRCGLIESTPTRLMKVLQIGNSLRAHDFCSLHDDDVVAQQQAPKENTTSLWSCERMFSAQVHSHCTLSAREHVVQIKNQENAITSFCRVCVY